MITTILFVALAFIVGSVCGMVFAAVVLGLSAGANRYTKEFDGGYNHDNRPRVYTTIYDGQRPEGPSGKN